MIYRIAPISMTLSDPYPGFKVTNNDSTLNISETVRDNTHSVLNSVISNDLEWLRKKFNDIEAWRGLSVVAELLDFFANIICRLEHERLCCD